MQLPPVAGIISKLRLSGKECGLVQYRAHRKKRRQPPNLTLGQDAKVAAGQALYISVSQRFRSMDHYGYVSRSFVDLQIIQNVKDTWIGHYQVQKNQGRKFKTCTFRGLRSGCLDNAKARSAKKLPDEVPGSRLIINHQNGVRLPLSIGRAGLARGLRCRPYRQAEGERGALSDNTFHRQAATHQFREPPRQGKTEAGPLQLALDRVVDLRKFLKDPFLIFRGDSDPGVFHSDANFVAAFRKVGGHPDLALLRKFQCIGDQVPQYLAELTFIGVDCEIRGRLFEY